MLILETAIAMTAASAGAAAGWCIRRSRETPDRLSPGQTIENREALEQEAQNNRQATKDLLSQVHGLTTKVASQVGEHNLRVQAISQPLTNGEQLDPAAVTSAINRLVEANAWMHQQLDSAHSKLESQARLIESHVNEARTDALTGIANRRAFNEEMQRCLANLRTEREPACVMMIDVDHFKKFNDTHGHKAGDEVLRLTADRLKGCLRITDTVARFGGDEFVVIAELVAATADVIAVANKVIEAVARPIPALWAAVGAPDVRISCSIGISQYPRDSEDPDTLIRLADAAMYQAKLGNRGRIVEHR